ncbi:MAG: methylated-DNA--[protein]-cysteine S-methyltransferase, partial [Gemmatimonadota bacterium]
MLREKAEATSARPHLHAAVIDTPVGVLVAVVNAAGAATHLLFDGDRSRAELEAALGAGPGDVAWNTGRCAPLLEQLREYFGGERRTFDHPVAPEGSRFELRVWAALAEIPYGRTLSYGALARRLGDANLSRAVGRANGANPLPIVVPCHRVIGANGKLVGYGGEIWRKEALLRLEGALLV